MAVKNLAWYLPRPKPDRYKGGMPLYCEDWLIDEAKSILRNPAPKILHLFCGMGNHGLRVDIRREVQPHIVADAHTIDRVLATKFDVILADPPYSDDEAAELYGTPPLNYRKWTRAADKLLVDGGLLIVYHRAIKPNPMPGRYNVVRRIFVGHRINHGVRAAIYFQKTRQIILIEETNATD